MIFAFSFNITISVKSSLPAAGGVGIILMQELTYC